MSAGMLTLSVLFCFLEVEAGGGSTVASLRPCLLGASLAGVTSAGAAEGAGRADPGAWEVGHEVGSVPPTGVKVGAGGGIGAASARLSRGPSCRSCNRRRLRRRRSTDISEEKARQDAKVWPVEACVCVYSNRLAQQTPVPPPAYLRILIGMRGQQAASESH